MGASEQRSNPPNQIVGFDPQCSPLKKEEESLPHETAERAEHTEQFVHGDSNALTRLNEPAEGSQCAHIAHRNLDNLKELKEIKELKAEGPTEEEKKQGR